MLTVSKNGVVRYRPFRPQFHPIHKDWRWEPRIEERKAGRRDWGAWQAWAILVSGLDEGVRNP